MRYNDFKIKKTFEVQIQSDIQRKIKLMKFISSEKRWYTLEELSTVINASTKTISKDLGIIKGFIPNTWDIRIQKGIGVKLFIPANESVEEINCILFRKSLTFQVLSKLLKQGETTVANLAEELHIQPYMVTRVLKKLEQDLIHYDLKLHRKPLKIVGPENKIIFMYSELYFRAYLNLDWPFCFNQGDIFNLIEEIENSCNLVLFLSSRRFFSYYIAILLLRKKQNYSIEQLDPIFNSIEGTPCLIKTSVHLDRFSKKYGLHFSKPDKIILTAVFQCLNYIYKNSESKNELDIQLFKENEIDIFNLVSEFIDELYKKFRYPFIKKEDFFYSVLIHFRKRMYSLQFYPYIKTHEPSTLSEMKKKYLKTYLKVKEIYINWIKKHKITNSIPEEEILNIVLYIEAAQICANLKVTKILVITKEGDLWSKYIEAILKDKFGNKIELLSVFSDNLSRGYDLLEPEYDVDLLVSTMPLQISSHPVIQIQPFVSKSDLDNIQYYLDHSETLCKLDLT